MHVTAADYTKYVIILFLSLGAAPSESIRCYRCSVTLTMRHINESRRLCSEFDYSDKYEVDCPFSTMCMKKTYTVFLQKPINGTMRDCALQKNDYQKLENGAWRSKISIEEPYQEGCFQNDDKGLRSSKTSYCYCRGDFCNRGLHLRPYSVIFLLNAIYLVDMFIF